MNQYLPEFFVFASAHLFSLISPGPDFFMVAQSSLRYSRKSALLISLGISFGEMVHVAYSLIGVKWLANNTQNFFMALKILGATYLAYLGIKTLFSSQKEHFREGIKLMKTSSLLSSRQAITRGFFTNALNAKAGFFTFSFFSVLVSQSTPVYIQLFYAIFIQLSTLIWFSIVALFLTQTYTRSVFYNNKHWIERICGSILIILAFRLLIHKA